MEGAVRDADLADGLTQTRIADNNGNENRVQARLLKAAETEIFRISTSLQCNTIKKDCRPIL